jgi:glycosyltransferase involved in cell wall biosynthesis
MKQRIWIISLYEPTFVDNTRPMRYMSIASALQHAGVEVTYFSNTFRHSNKHVRFEEQTTLVDPEGVRVVFIQSPAYQKNLSYERIQAHKTYTKNLLRFMNESTELPALILCAFPPIDTPLAVANWASKRGIPFVFDVIDPWPDVLLRLFPDRLQGVGNYLLYSFNQKVKKLIRQSAGIVAISNQYIDWAKSKQAGTYQTKAFYPSVPLAEVREKLASKVRQEDPRLRLIYAGNLGIAYDIPCILQAAAVLEEQHPGKTLFTIAGVGEHAALVENYAKRYANIRYVGRLGYDDLMEAYANADLGLAQYSLGATQSVTYKFFDYLGAGLPMLNSLRSEMWELIDQHGLGANNAYGDSIQLATNIERYLKDRALLEASKDQAVKFTESHGDNATVYTQFADFLIGMASPS